MMKKYIRHIPNNMNYDLFPYNIIFSNNKYNTVVGVIDKKYYSKTISIVHMLPFTSYDIGTFYNAKMSKSIADIIVKELIKCT